jgi:hypothetical protein
MSQLDDELDEFDDELDDFEYWEFYLDVDDYEEEDAPWL